MPRFLRPRASRQTLLGGAVTVLAALLALPANAQLAPVSATGDKVVSNAQSSNTLTIATGDGSRSAIAVDGPTDGATVAVKDNGFSSAARGNNATLMLAPDAVLTAPSLRTSLRTAPGSVDGTANLLIANSQDLRGGEVVADEYGSPLRFSLGSVAMSNVAIGTNIGKAEARGNAVTTTIGTTALAGGGAGIVNLQKSGGPVPMSGEYDGVAARIRGGSLLETGAVRASRLSSTGNHGVADAASNAADNSLAAAVTVAAPGNDPMPGDGPGPIMMLTVPGSTSGALDARFALLNRQQAGNTVKARSGYLIDNVLDGGPATRTVIGGDADTSSILSDDNGLASTAKGNASSNMLALTGSVDDAGGNAAIAALGNIQTLDGARVIASTHGGAGVDIAGTLTGSSVSTSSNSASADAAGNVASSNSLTVSGAMAGKPSGPASAFGSASDGAFRLDNDQDYGATSVSANSAGLSTRITIAGATDRSSVASVDNSTAGRATGNSASNAMTFDVPRFDGSAALGNRQVGNGSVTVSIGQPTDASGSTVVVGDVLRGSNVTVTGNNVTGRATGSVAANNVTVSGATVNGDGMSGSVGALDTDFGAIGTLALFSGQTLGAPDNGNALPSIATSLNVRTGVTGDADVTGSSLAISGNSNKAVSTANEASNRIETDAARLDGASAALSSTQFGQASVASTITSTFATPVGLNEASLSLTDNSSAAVAAINDVDNSISLAGPGATGNGTALASAGSLGTATGTGTAVLSNQQFAAGSATATLTSQFGTEGMGGVANSRLTISGNTATADSSGNRALNTLAIDAPDGGASAALVSSQVNTARSGASATLSTPGSALGPVDGSSLSVASNVASAVARGNAADNALMVAGQTGPGAMIVADHYGTDGSAGAILANAQTNFGAVTARTGDMIALNAGSVTGSTVSVANNAMVASAYGNAATNNVTVWPLGQPGGVALTNLQTNYAPVSATVIGAGFQSGAMSLRSGKIGVTGNQISAVAVGNQASSAIASPR